MTIISGHSLIYFQNNTISENILLTDNNICGIVNLGILSPIFVTQGCDSNGAFRQHIEF